MNWFIKFLLPKKLKDLLFYGVVSVVVLLVIYYGLGYLLSAHKSAWVISVMILFPIFFVLSVIRVFAWIGSLGKAKAEV